MTTATKRLTTTLPLVMLIAGPAFAGCMGGETSEPASLEVAGASAELQRRDDDNDGHDDNDDFWRCGKGYGNDKHNRNKCPAIDAIAQPQAVKVGETTRLKGFAFDVDGPRSLKYTWSVTPTTIGTIANKTSKRTTFKCLVAGKAHLTFSVTDGDCTRTSKVDVECKPTTAAKCGDGAKNGNELCDNSSSNPADRCPTTCNDNQACTADTLAGSAATCDAHCVTAPVTACKSADGCCPKDCTNPTDLDCKPLCGDKVKNGTETCDNSSPNAADKCLTTCDDQNACTKDTMSGSAATCNVACSHEAIPGCGVVTCGDGQFDPTKETCDNSSSTKCPASCDDSQACTTDSSSGSAATCDLACKHEAVTTCKSGDGCCAPGCNKTNDSECTAVCGNGIPEQGEICDGNCPMTCTDTDPCTKDTLSGDPTKCTAVCTHEAVTTCSGDTVDQCCPGTGSGCNANNDKDCRSVCGNGTIEPSGGETCDPLTSCPTACSTTKTCMKAVLSGDPLACTSVCSEVAITACAGGDGCCAPGCNSTSDSDCLPAQPACGDMKKNGAETCDNSSPNAADKCPASCNDNDPCTTDSTFGSAATCDIKCTHSAVTTCSTGVVGDQCCPANCNAGNDGDCVIKCGDGAVSPPTETCDGNCPTSCDDGKACTADSMTGTPATCDVVCTNVPLQTAECLCGNGTIDPSTGETCDGTASCSAEAAKCNDNDPCTNDVITGDAAHCNIKCTHTRDTSTSGCGVCGDGQVTAGETCDGNCPTTCTQGADKCKPTVLQGTAAQCNVKCVEQPITACANGDMCCPSGGACTGANDNDCGSVETPCEKCENLPRTNQNCVKAIPFCKNFPGSGTVNGATVTLASLCVKEIDCIHMSKCAGAGVPTDCLCGADADPGECFAEATLPSANFNGVCAADIVNAAQSAKGSDLNTRFFDKDFASGAADAWIETCDQFFCTKECLQ